MKQAGAEDPQRQCRIAGHPRRYGEIARVQARRADSLLQAGLDRADRTGTPQPQTAGDHRQTGGGREQVVYPRNEPINANIELGSLEAEYSNKISKAESELNSALSHLYETQAEIAKMNIDFSNLSIRSSFLLRHGSARRVCRTGESVGVGENIAKAT